MLELKWNAWVAIGLTVLLYTAGAYLLFLNPGTLEGRTVPLPRPEQAARP